MRDRKDRFERDRTNKDPTDKSYWWEGYDSDLSRELGKDNPDPCPPEPDPEDDPGSNHR